MSEKNMKKIPERLVAQVVQILNQGSNFDQKHFVINQVIHQLRTLKDIENKKKKDNKKG